MDNSIRIWEETVIIPTYPVKEPDRNPMFLEKRVNQGTSGRTYPLPVISGISDEKVDRPYQAVWIENEWVRVMVLPELGGRIQVAQDKTNGYYFFYKQSVIKPALIGLAGPWISGGVEFNWPQHHRPTTFNPVDYRIEEHPDGSKTVWMGEIEPLYRMKGMVGITLRPGTSVVEARVQLYNRTPFPHPFMWWANVAVRINDEYQAFFPTDVGFVTDHARRAMSAFPIARGTYYGVDYSEGVDITWTKNMRSAGSYFVMKTDYDFFGGYDHHSGAGVVNVANRFIAPGKKMFNWGNWEAGHRWQRNLTDEDGEYVELMAGVYTDNQPDFSWLQPYETRQFSQYWYPIQKIGTAQNANLEAAISLKVEDGQARMGAAVTGRLDGCRVVLSRGSEILLDTRVDLTPGTPFTTRVDLPAGTEAHHLRLALHAADGREMIHYTPPEPREVIIPEAFKPAPFPEEIATNEELYLTGLHLEQYRHPTRDPEPYYEEALRRDPGDARCNNALGLLMLRRGQFEEAAGHFATAIERLTRYNPNPYDGEPYYNLGLAKKWLGRLDEAYTALYKATWNQSWASAGYFTLAQIDCQRGQWATALEHLNKSLAYMGQNLGARNLKSAALRRSGRVEEALALAAETKAFDLLDYGARWELCEGYRALGDFASFDRELAELIDLTGGRAQAWIETALDYANAGLADEALRALDQAVYAAHAAAKPVFPMVFYLQAWIAGQAGDEEKARAYVSLARQMPAELCFPSRIEEMLALEAAIRRDPTDPRAPYYLGNLLRDKQRFSEARERWETAAALDPSFPTAHRNLALAYFNECKDPARARQSLETAFTLGPADARVLYELVLLLDQLGASPAERLALLESHRETVMQRDDLYLEWVMLVNASGDYKRAAELIEQRTFHPWEGGEGAVTRAYIWSHLGMALEAFKAGDAARADAEMQRALAQPESLGEGRGWGHPQTNLFYFAGRLAEQRGDSGVARGWYQKAFDTTPWGLSEFTFFKGLAARRLGKDAEAEAIFKQMIDAAKEQAGRKPQVPYFAASLPLFLMLGDGGEVRARRGQMMAALAQAGLGETDQARAELQAMLPLPQDPNFIQVALEEIL